MLQGSEQSVGVRIVIRDMGPTERGDDPSDCSVEIIVLARMGSPLYECSTTPRGLTLPSRKARVMSSVAISTEFASAIRPPTILRLQTSMTRKRCRYTPRTPVGN